MSTMQLTRHGAVWVLTLTNGDKDNTFNPDVLREHMEVFDRIEADKDNAALLITSDHPKTWCNGIDLAWLMTQPQEVFRDFIIQLEDFFLRVALLNLPTIACITGNAYAGGAIMASACDFRLMRSDKGRMCFSEVKIKMPFTDVMLEVIQLLPNRKALRDMALTSNAYGGMDCLAMDVVDRIHSEDELFHNALEFATEMSTKHRPTYATIKHGLRKSIVELHASRKPA